MSNSLKSQFNNSWFYLESHLITFYNFQQSRNNPIVIICSLPRRIDGNVPSLNKTLFALFKRNNLPPSFSPDCSGLKYIQNKTKMLHYHFVNTKSCYFYYSVRIQYFDNTGTMVILADSSKCPNICIALLFSLQLLLHESSATSIECYLYSFTYYNTSLSDNRQKCWLEFLNLAFLHIYFLQRPVSSTWNVFLEQLQTTI